MNEKELLDVNCFPTINVRSCKIYVHIYMYIPIYTSKYMRSSYTQCVEEPEHKDRNAKCFSVSKHADTMLKRNRESRNKKKIICS